MVAHGLYQSLGYVDVHTPELAVLNCVGTRKKPEGYELKHVRAVDSDLIERLHEKATKGRVGFTPRPRGIVASLLKLGWLKLESIRLILRDGEPVGYAILEKNPGWSKLDELVATDAAQLEDVLSLFESEAKGCWLTIRNTVVRDSADLLRNRHYLISPYAYYSLLGLPIAGHDSDVMQTLGTQNPLFTCQMLDYF